MSSTARTHLRCPVLRGYGRAQVGLGTAMASVLYDSVVDGDGHTPTRCGRWASALASSFGCMGLSPLTPRFGHAQARHHEGGRSRGEGEDRRLGGARRWRSRRVGRPGVDRRIRRGLLVSGSLYLAGLLGPALNAVAWRELGVFRYSVVLPLACLALSRAFASAPSPVADRSWPENSVIRSEASAA